MFLRQRRLQMKMKMNEKMNKHCTRMSGVPQDQAVRKRRSEAKQGAALQSAALRVADQAFKARTLNPRPVLVSTNSIPDKKFQVFSLNSSQRSEKQAKSNFSRTVSMHMSFAVFLLMRFVMARSAFCDRSSTSMGPDTIRPQQVMRASKH